MGTLLGIWPASLKHGGGGGGGTQMLAVVTVHQ